MAFDAGMVLCVVREVNERASEGKVERVCQPTKDSIDIALHKGRDTYHLYISASSNTPRLSFTAVPKENPAVPPMFCMLLRKHLSGAKLMYAEQVGFERVVKLHFSAYDEMGFPCEKMIIAEIMGKFSNIILTDGEGKIISANKIIDFSVSSKRQLLPTMMYELPPSQEKLNPLLCGRGEVIEVLTAQGDIPAYKAILTAFMGISGAVAREIVFRATGDSEAMLKSCGVTALAEGFCKWFSALVSGEVSPYLITKNGELCDYAYERMTYASDCASEVCGSFSELLDTFFSGRENAERIKARASDIIHIVSSAKSRLARKIELQTRELADSERGEEYRRDADLITANIYRMKRGDKVLTAVDYNDPEMPEVSVALSERLTPAQNAQRLYKLYNKAKNSKKYLTEQIAIARAELDYIQSVEVSLDNAECEADLIEMREELRLAGYAKRMGAASAQSKQKKSKISEFVTSGGYRLLCGRNNTQNDYITFKLADKGDLWFHVKGMHGSHVILVCGGEEPSERDYTEACALAAYYSEADKRAPVEVDYTRVKNIKKPQGAKPGYVIYHTNYSAYVMPSLPDNTDS